MRYEQWVTKHLKVSSRFGEEALVFCPIHKNSSTPAMSVNLSKGLYICYSCGAKGHLSDLSLRLGAPLTAVFDAEALGQGLARLRAGESPTEATQKLPEEWLDRFGWKKPHRYWTEERKIAPDVCRKWKLGYDSHSNSGTIPIRDMNGNVLGVIRRRLGKLKEGEPRYLYPRGFKISWHLYGAHFLKDEKLDQVVITEGSLDCIAMDQAGFHSVALLGARLHPHQLTILSGLDVDTIVLSLDNDRAGRHATQTVAAQLLSEGFTVQVARTFRGKKDPSSMALLQRKMSVNMAESYLRLRLRNASA